VPHSRSRALLAGALATLVTAAAPLEPPPVRFPTIRADALSGRSYTLPRDFAGRANLVLIAFRREQQADVDTWLPAARALAASSPEVRYYELPTIGRGYVLMRPIIARGMRGGVTDPEARDATITLYTNVDQFRATLGLASADVVHALLLDGDGVVRWRAEGRLDAAREAALRQAVDAVLDGPPPARRTGP
jgi:hypothetical protein